MADPSSQTTNDTTDWHDASMANDDSSVMTEVMGAKTSSKAPQMVEKVVKFVFRVNNEQASTIAQRHVLLLKTIDDAFGTEVMIYTNANKKMKKFKLAGFPEYQRMFSIHHKRGNSKQKHKRTATYTVIHRIQTSVSLQTIRHQEQISHLLRQYKCSMQHHPWTEDVTDVVSLGFLVHVDPVNHTKEYVSQTVLTKLKKENPTQLDKIPLFQVAMSSPSHWKEDNTRVSTKSYDIQVERQYAKTMIKLIKEAYKVSKDFIFYRMRYQVPETFLAAIKAQNVFLRKSRVVPIEGINADMMSELRPKLLQLIGVKEVLPHWKTTSEGRWNLLTEDKDFSTLVKYLEEYLNEKAERHSAYA